MKISLSGIVEIIWGWRALVFLQRNCSSTFMVAHNCPKTLISENTTPFLNSSGIRHASALNTYVETEHSLAKNKTNPLKWHCIWSDTFYSINVYKKAINTFSKSKTLEDKLRIYFIYLNACYVIFDAFNNIFNIILKEKWKSTM